MQGQHVPGFLNLLLSGFLKLTFVRKVCMCVHVCPPSRLLITTHMKRSFSNQLNKFLYCFPVFMAPAINTVDGTKEE